VALLSCGTEKAPALLAGPLVGTNHHYSNEFLLKRPPVSLRWQESRESLLILEFGLLCMTPELFILVLSRSNQQHLFTCTRFIYSAFEAMLMAMARLKISEEDAVG